MIQENDLTKKEYLDELKLEVQDIINEDRFREAYDLSKSLSSALDSLKNFKQANNDLYKEYKELIRKLRWIGLPIVVPEKVVDMFQYHFSVIYDIPEYDVFAKLRTVLLGIIILDERDKFKKQLREALLRNEEKLTSKKLIMNNVMKDPTAGNWLADYNQTLGTGKINGLARTEYLVNGQNIRNLADEEKKKVKLLFDLYERLKLSSQTFEGLEDEITLDEKEATGVIKNGVFEPFKQTEKQKQIWQMIEDFMKERGGSETAAAENNNQLEQLKQLASQYPVGSFERKAVEEELGKLNDK